MILTNKLDGVSRRAAQPDCALNKLLQQPFLISSSMPGLDFASGL